MILSDFFNYRLNVFAFGEKMTIFFSLTGGQAKWRSACETIGACTVLMAVFFVN